MQEYDVAIIGAGPAGSHLLRLLQDRNLKIAIVDSRNLDQAYEGKGRIKSCGGMIAPDAQKILKKHKINLPSDVFDAVQPQYVKTFDAKSGIVKNYKRNYLNINREMLDRFLLKKLNADKYFGCVVSEIRKDNGYYIINNMIKTKILVGADGASSKVRKIFFPNLKIRNYVSIQDVIKPQISKKYECYFDENISDYYGWSLPKGDATLVGFAIAEGDDVLEKFASFKQKNGFGKETERQGTFILRPNFWHKVSCDEGIFLIGEAGGYISPSSAEGISYALKTAEILANSNFYVKSFRKKMVKIQLNIFYKNLKSLVMSVPFLRRIVMRLSLLN